MVLLRRVLLIIASRLSVELRAVKVADLRADE